LETKNPVKPDKAVYPLKLNKAVNPVKLDELWFPGRVFSQVKGLAIGGKVVAGV